MSNEKKYADMPILFKTKCIDSSNTTFLHIKWYNVISEDNDNYLIKFNSGGAKWYSKQRFKGIYK